MPATALAKSILVALLPLVAWPAAGWSTAAPAADSLRKYRFLAKTARETKDWDNALLYYGKQLEYEEDSKRRRSAYYQSAKIEASAKKDPQRAAALLLRALQIDSTYANANNLLSHIYRQAGKQDSAALCLERLVAARPQKTQFRRTLADLYRRQGRIAEACRHYESLIEQTGESSELLEILALLEESAGRHARALEWRRRLLALQSKDKPGAAAGQRATLEQILALQRHTGDVRGALETLGKLLVADPANSFSYYTQTVELAEQVDDQEVRRRGLEGMAGADPGSAAVVTLVELHLHEKRLDQARRWLEHGMAAAAGNAQLLLLRGDLLVLEGREEEALQAFERAKQDPNWKRVAQQRIWILRPPETEEEKLKKEFFGAGDSEG